MEAKMKYESPEAEIIVFEGEDIIRTSGNDTPTPPVPIPDGMFKLF